MLISAQALDVARNTDATSAQKLEAATYNVQVAASELKIARAGPISVNADPGKPGTLIELRSSVSGRVLRVLEKSSEST